MDRTRRSAKSSTAALTLAAGFLGQGAMPHVSRDADDGHDLSGMDLQVDGQQLRGEPLRLARNVNGLVDQLSSIADEITRVTREVGTEGKLGGQARVRSADGSWRDLIDAEFDPIARFSSSSDGCVEIHMTGLERCILRTVGEHGESLWQLRPTGQQTEAVALNEDALLLIIEEGLGL